MYKVSSTAQKMNFSMKNLFIKCDQIRKKLKKSLMENFFLVQNPHSFHQFLENTYQNFSFTNIQETFTDFIIITVISR